ncbi:MAG: D-alanyl-D-alanine carboxypeptidase, partial [Clostridiales bacterium]|nr:D-alanyl-D-alanine carboxypeptidase [Clostridiales bacterium]
SNVTISKDSVDAEGSALSLEVGEKYSLEDLLYAIMLSSANDAAKAVAEYVSGDTASFVIKMNETAARLKMDNTHFTNPTGLYDEGQYTTASDISAMIRYAISNSTFEKMFSTNARPWIHKDGSTSILTSQNKLFWSFSGIEGGKTGYNKKELQSLITTAARNDLRLVCVVLDSPEESVFPDATALMEIGFSNFRKGILVKAEDKIDTVKIDGTPVNLIAAEDVYYVHPNGDSYIKDLTISTDSSVPFKKGKIAGTATYLLNDGTTIDIALYPENEIIQSEDFLTTAKDKITENKDILYLIYFLIIIEIFLFISNIIKLLVKLKKRLQKPQ